MEKTIWTKHGFVENKYHLVEDEAEFYRLSLQNKNIIVPHALYLEIVKNNQDNKNIGVFIKSDEDIDDLLPYLDKTPIIVLDIPVFSDGRAYSKAARLKTRYGYQGEIRATGNILIDQISNLLRCYFDTLEISHALTKKRLESLELVQFPGFYQPASGLQQATQPNGFSRRFVGG